MKHRDRDDVLARLKLKVFEELVGEVYDPGVYALEVDDWFVVIGDGFDYLDKVKRAGAASLSATGDEVLYLFTNDTTMAFELTMFAGGNPLWSITYDGRDGVSTPVFEGAIPWRARTLLAKLEKEQAKAGGPKAEVDHIYTLAPAYAMELVGFRHDETLASGDRVPIWQIAPKASR